MRRILVLLALAALVLAVESPARSDDADKSFFNGKDLDGWEGLTKEYWSVKEGAIIGSTFPEGIKFNTFLCSKKKYRDFELKCQIRLKDGKGNSGIQIRSELIDMKQYPVKGPQADVGEGFWGSLYGERFGGMMKEAPKEKVNKSLKKDDFNDYYVKCVGKHCLIRVNDVVTVDQEFDKMPEEGIIAWQLHGGGPMEVTFKNIEFKSLDKK
jgi:hypothetical protein